MTSVANDGVRAILGKHDWKLALPDVGPKTVQWIESVDLHYDENQQVYQFFVKTKEGLAESDRIQVENRIINAVDSIMAPLAVRDPESARFELQISSALAPRLATGMAKDKGWDTKLKQKAEEAVDRYLSHNEQKASAASEAIGTSLDERKTTATLPSLQRFNNMVREVLGHPRLYKLPYSSEPVTEATTAILTCIQIDYDPTGVYTKVLDYNSQVDVLNERQSSKVEQNTQAIADLRTTLGSKLSAIVNADSKFIQDYTKSVLAKAKENDIQAIRDLVRYAKERVEQAAVFEKQKAKAQHTKTSQANPASATTKANATNTGQEPTTGMDTKANAGCAMCNKCTVQPAAGGYNIGSPIEPRTSTGACACSAGKLGARSHASACACALADLD